MTSNLSFPYGASILIDDSPDIRPAVNDNWQARRELADALRRLNTAALTSDASSEQLRAAAALIHAEAAHIEKNPRRYGREAHCGPCREEDKPDLRYETTPAAGFSNAVAPKMHIWREGERVFGSVTPDWSYEGPSGHLHGGIVAMLFDHFIGTGQRITGTVGHTGVLTIRYHELTPVNKPLRLVAEVKRVQGRKKIMAGELWAEGVKTASAEGLFIMRKVPLAPFSGEPAPAASE